MNIHFDIDDEDPAPTIEANVLLNNILFNIYCYIYPISNLVPDGSGGVDVVWTNKDKDKELRLHIFNCGTRYSLYFRHGSDSDFTNDPTIELIVLKLIDLLR